MGWKYLPVVNNAAEATILSKKAYNQLKKKPSVIEEINLNGLNVGAPIWGQKIEPISPLGPIHTGMYMLQKWVICVYWGWIHHHGVNIKLSSHSIGIKGEEIFASSQNTRDQH